MMTNDAECLATISWDELVIGDILKYNLIPDKGTGDEEEHYEIILSVSRDFAKTLNTKRTDQNKFSRERFSLLASGTCQIEGKDFVVLRDDTEFSPMASQEDLNKWRMAEEEKARQAKENAQNLLANLDKLARLQKRVNPLKTDDGSVPFEQLQEEWNLCLRTGKAGIAVVMQWRAIYGDRFGKEWKARNPGPDPAGFRG